MRDSEKSCLSILFFLAALARRGNIGHVCRRGGTVDASDSGMRIGNSVRTQSPKDAVRGASPCRLRKNRQKACNICGVLPKGERQLMTATPHQKKP